jgi:RNA polymerase primary sigma factor
MFDSEDRRQVLDELERMDPREAAVLRMRFGLDNDDPMTLKEIGERLGLTRERVRQIEKEALGKLSDSMQPQ